MKKIIIGFCLLSVASGAGNAFAQQTKVAVIPLGGSSQATATWAGGDQSLALSATDTIVRSVTLSPSTAGVIIVNVSASVMATDPSYASVRCSITTGTTVDTLNGIYTSTRSASSYEFLQLAGTRGFNVTPGTYTYNLVCDEFSGTTSITDSQMTAMFIPVAGVTPTAAPAALPSKDTGHNCNQDLNEDCPDIQ